jgi:hypothetical protein
MMSKDDKKAKMAATAEVATPAAVSADPEPAALPVETGECRQIAALAHSYWQARGCPEGSPHEDWYRAENDVRQRVAAAAAG